MPPPPIGAGTFELGGQVPGGIAHAAQMQQAGMHWVKFQATGYAAGLIAAGHAAGFKVLLSASGDHGRAALAALTAGSEMSWREASYRSGSR